METEIPSSSVVPSKERHKSSKVIVLRVVFVMIVFAFLEGVIVCGGGGAFFLGVAAFFLGDASSSSS